MSSFLCPVKFNGNQALSLVFENLATAPAMTSAGLVYFDTSLDILRVRNTADTAWIDIPASAVVVSSDVGNSIISGSDSGAFFQETQLAITTDGNANGVALSGTNAHTADITLLSTDANNGLSLGSDFGLYFNPTEQEVVTTFGDLPTVDLQSGQLALVTDASGDPTVDNGGALYAWSGSAWEKIAEFSNVEGFKSVTTPQAQAGALVGRTIAVADDGDAATATVDIQESVTTFTDNLDGTLTHVSEDNTATSFTILRKYAEDAVLLGGVPTTVTHNLNTTDVQVGLWKGTEKVEACVNTSGANAITVLTTAAEALRVVVVG